MDCVLPPPQIRMDSHYTKFSRRYDTIPSQLECDNVPVFIPARAMLDIKKRATSASRVDLQPCKCTFSGWRTSCCEHTSTRDVRSQSQCPKHIVLKQTFEKVDRLLHLWFLSRMPLCKTSNLHCRSIHILLLQLTAVFHIVACTHSSSPKVLPSLVHLLELLRSWFPFCQGKPCLFWKSCS